MKLDESPYVSKTVFYWGMVLLFGYVTLVSVVFLYPQIDAIGKDVVDIKVKMSSVETNMSNLLNNFEFKPRR